MPQGSIGGAVHHVALVGEGARDEADRAASVLHDRRRSLAALQPGGGGYLARRARPRVPCSAGARRGAGPGALLTSQARSALVRGAAHAPAEQGRRDRPRAAAGSDGAGRIGVALAKLSKFPCQNDIRSGTAGELSRILSGFDILSGFSGWS